MNKIDKLIQTIRDLKEEAGAAAIGGGAPTNNASGGAIAGLPPDSPPVKIDLRKGRRRHWNPFFKELEMIRRKNKK